MLRHIETVHHEAAMIGRIPKYSLPPYARYYAVYDAPFPSFHNQKKEEVKKAATPNHIDHLMEDVRKIAEFQENCKKVFANASGPPSYYFPGPFQVQWPVAHDTPLGFRVFICKTCYQPEFVLFYLSDDPKRRGGLPTHVCPLDRAKHIEGRNEELLKGLNDSMIHPCIRLIEQWTEGMPILHAIKAHELPSFPEQLNHVNFGIVGMNDFIYKAAKEGVTLISDPIELLYFVSMANGTYCFCEFTYNGSKEFYLMLIHPQMDTVRTTAAALQSRTAQQQQNG